MRSLSFKTRLWLGHVTVLAAMLALAAFGADWSLRRVVLGQVIDDAIFSLASTEAAALEADPRQVHVHEMPPGASHPSFARLDKFVQIIDLEGTVVARGATLGIARLPVSRPLLERLRDGETVFATITSFDEPVRMVSIPVAVGPHRYAVQVAMSLDDAYAVLRAGRWLVLGLSVAILAAVGLTGALLARQALRPIDQIVTQARRIGEANLAERLPQPRTHDEIGRLVETLNDMLGRLEKSFEVQRRFTTDASHELRSPLSRLRAELELAIRRRREVAEYEETLRSSLDEVERLQELVEELLELARIDAGQEREPARPIAAGELVEAAVAGINGAAERRGVAIVVDCPPDIMVNAAPLAARVALGNILDNAVKFSPSGGTVTVTVTAGRREAVMAVADSGPGILPDELPRLFERFYRGSASRTTATSGVGLGLAISQAFLERQGGRISVAASAGGGAAFSIHLPRV